MNNINRVVVKSQAKQIIKDKVFVLFIVTAVASFLFSGMSTIGSAASVADATKQVYDNSIFDDDSDLDDYDDYYDFGQYYDEDGDNPIENFGNESYQSYGSENALSDAAEAGTINMLSSVVSGLISSIAYIFTVIFCPLIITLEGFYIYLIRKNPAEELQLGSELKNLFKRSFDSTFLKKLVLYILKALFTALWSLLFIVPGIVYSYSTYFAYQLMNDYPNLKPTEALKLSRKITTGNRTELFVLELSFIPWYMLCGITCGIAYIYFAPYYYTTKALYYENFRLRAIAEGRVNELDFLSADELAARYGQANPQGNTYYPGADAANGQYSAPHGSYSNTYEQYAQYGNQQANYYNPNTQYTNNQQSSYYNPNSQQGYGAQQQNGYYYQPQQNTDAQQQSAQQSGYSYAQPQGDGQQQGEYNDAYTQPQQSAQDDYYSNPGSYYDNNNNNNTPQ